MKLFSFAAFLTSLVLVGVSIHRRHRHSTAPGITDAEKRYAIDDLLNGLD